MEFNKVPHAEMFLLSSNPRNSRNRTHVTFKLLKMLLCEILPLVNWYFVAPPDLDIRLRSGDERGELSQSICIADCP